MATCNVSEVYGPISCMIPHFHDDALPLKGIHISAQHDDAANFQSCPCPEGNYAWTTTFKGANETCKILQCLPALHEYIYDSGDDEPQNNEDDDYIDGGHWTWVDVDVAGVLGGIALTLAAFILGWAIKQAYNYSAKKQQQRQQSLQGYSRI